MKNYYPEKPIVPYRGTVVNMATVIKDLQALEADNEVKRMAYIMFRNESSNGRKGINQNYCGFQADSGRWAKAHDEKIVGVVNLKENGTNKLRLFLAFENVADCLAMLVERVIGRGLYIGGTTYKVWKDNKIDSVGELCRAYKKEWVAGSVEAEPTKADLDNFLSMYRQAEKLFK